MIMKKSLLLMTGMIIFMTSCTKTNKDTLTDNTASPTSTHTIAGKHSRPFKGSINYAFATNFDLPCDCGSYSVAGNFYGTGNFTELGLTTSKIKPCVSPIYATRPTAPVTNGHTAESPFLGGTPIGNHVGVECASFVAANGDELYLSIRPYDLMFGPAAAVGTCYVDIVGGTGRFTTATGTFSGTVTVPYTTGTASMTGVDGVIEY
jgi:hypothetical protein